MNTIQAHEYTKREKITLKVTRFFIIFTGGIMFGYFWLAWVLGRI